MLNKALEIMDEGIIIFGKDLYIQYVNEAYEKMFLLNREEIVGKHLHDIYGDIPEDIRVASKTAETGEPQTYKAITFDWKGKHMVLNAYSKVFKQDGDIEFVLTRFIDVTEQAAEIERNRKMIEDMTVNLVPVTDDMAVLPLQPILEDFQKDILIDHAAKQIASSKIKKLVIDLSAITDMEPSLAHILKKLLAMLQMLGVETAISGVKPRAALELANSEMENETFRSTFNTLNQALKHF
ncbi:PAS domain-containing protein [Bacillus marinisedimentorum]|uniref:PAS domain-containing protein n=1 Tax=Bacillus marinisedimentorum TaxID=1821260 RepID=UPI000871E72A|nr:PAS domain-containing protein [Bacillus marinisedimentorum]